MLPIAQIRLRFLITLLFAVVLAAACASVGGVAPETNNQKIAAAQITITQLRGTAAALLNARKISSDDAANVLKQTDAAQEGILIARALASANDSTGAANRLQLITTGLAALQTYLSSK